MNQDKRVLERLQEKKAVTRVGGIKSFNPMILNIPARISTLRKMGFEIFSKKMPEDKPKYNVYYMEGSMWFQKYGKRYDR